MITKPPNWNEEIAKIDFPKNFLQRQEELAGMLKMADREYDYWDKFKHYPFPPGISAEEAWVYLKFKRSGGEHTPVQASNNNYFTFNITKTMYQRLSYIDSNTAGIKLLDWKPTGSQKNQLLLSGLTEEAIASSQIEGSNTSRKVAKNMILSNRKPRNTSEQMIINNFKVMQKLQDLKNLPLSIDMIVEIQKIITTNTLNNELDAGRLRNDEDEIAVVDKLTGEVVYVPPKRTIMEEQLNKLVVYVNTEQNQDEFVHPVIKACIVHFWLAYLHPFVDGNGRTARAIFYWYLLHCNYWLFQYLSVSRVIKTSKISYDRSFSYSELDENDLTYFIFYKLKTICKAVDDFLDYYKQKIQQEEKIRILSSKTLELNERQIAMLIYAKDHPDEEFNISKHQMKHQIAYETARQDLLFLVSKGYLTSMHKGRKFVYVASLSHIKKILDNLIPISGITNSTV